jgi:hypothetical protein
MNDSARIPSRKVTHVRVDPVRCPGLRCVLCPAVSIQTDREHPSIGQRRKTVKLSALRRFLRDEREGGASRAWVPVEEGRYHPVVRRLRIRRGGVLGEALPLHELRNEHGRPPRRCSARLPLQPPSDGLDLGPDEFVGGGHGGAPRVLRPQGRGTLLVAAVSGRTP